MTTGTEARRTSEKTRRTEFIARLRRAGLDREADELVSIDRRLAAQRRETAQRQRELRELLDHFSGAGAIRAAACQRLAARAWRQRPKAQRETAASLALYRCLDAAVAWADASAVSAYYQVAWAGAALRLLHYYRQAFDSADAGDEKE